MGRARLLRGATRDLNEIRQYLSELPAKPHLRIATEIRKDLNHIATYPFQGSPESELTRIAGQEVRSWLVESYRIYDLLAPPDVQVLAILHTARDHAAILRGRIQ